MDSAHHDFPSFGELNHCGGGRGKELLGEQERITMRVLHLRRRLVASIRRHRAHLFHIGEVSGSYGILVLLRDFVRLTPHDTEYLEGRSDGMNIG
jgi:hypothetical protein